MLSTDFEQNFGVFQSIGHVDLLITASQIQEEFCQLFWLKYREEHSAKNAIISYVQEIKLRRDNLVARTCHLVNMAKYT